MDVPWQAKSWGNYFHLPHHTIKTWEGFYVAFAITFKMIQLELGTNSPSMDMHLMMHKYNAIVNGHQSWCRANYKKMCGLCKNISTHA